MTKQFVIVLLFAASLFAQKITPNFSFVDSTYRADYALFCSAPNLSKQEMLDILFRYHHVVEYMGKFNLTITPIVENDTVSHVKLSYNYLIAKMTMEVIRNRSVDGSNVDFVMENYHRTKTILPLILITQGDYVLEKKSGGWIVHYSNHVKMDREIGGVYQSIIKRETRQYLKELQKYVEEQNELSL